MGTFGIGSTGLGAGFDVQALVDQIITAERGPVRLLQTQQIHFNAQAAALTSLQTKLTALKDKVTALHDPLGPFSAKAVVSSIESLVRAAADSSAVAAAHTVVVSSLATVASYYTGALANSSTAFSTGSFDIAVGGGAPTTVTVDATNNTLDGLAAHINSLGIGALASVVTDASGARLSLQSTTTGAPGDLLLANNSTGLTFTKSVTGANASLTVDGIPISSTTNTVSGAVAGLTFTLVGAAPGTSVNISVAPDNKKARAAVDEFVTAYNALVSDINSQFAFNAATKSAGALSGDSGVRSLQQSLLTGISYSFAGTGGFDNLAALGIEVLNDGTLRADSTKLDAALESNFAAVQNFFQASATGFAVKFSADLLAVADTSTGVIALSLTGVQNAQTTVLDQIRAFDDRLATRRQSLLEQLSRVNAQLQLLPVVLQQINQQLSRLS